ncbi:YqgQ family protein [Brevibacillus ginsengisoli]|uniref:YqgQ family protein n=1 Tax=Brevibacillus ginsengisoli TaxID=363854 RepID=UPI003CF61884
MRGKPEQFNLQEFLRRFGILIYTGDPEGDWILIEDEVRELRQMGIIDDEEYTTAMIEIRKAKRS